MPGEDTIAVPIGELRGVSTAGGGTSISTTAVRVPFPTQCDFMQFEGRAFTTAVVLQVLLNPWLVIVKTTDLLVAQANATLDGIGSPSVNQSDGTALVMGAFDTIANKNALYIGAHLPFAGLDVTVGSVNSVASVMTVKYWKTNSTWTTTSATDNTAAVGATLAQNGTVTWTVPTDWQKATLDSGVNAAPKATGDTTTLHGSPFNDPLYWVRLEVSAALTNPTTITKMLSINRSTVYAEYPPGVFFEERFMQGMGGIGAVQARTDAGTGSLIINGGTTGNRTGLK